MREIKFRVWDIPEKEYLKREKVVVGNSQKRESYIYIWRSSVDSSSNTLEWMMDDPECYIVEQYTGLHDKSGREIYEGDLILIGAVFTQIKYRNETAAFELMQKHGPIVLSNKYSGEYEIIGNIHENPEILK